MNAALPWVPSTVDFALSSMDLILDFTGRESKTLLCTGFEGLLTVRVRRDILSLPLSQMKTKGRFKKAI